VRATGNRLAALAVLAMAAVQPVSPARAAIIATMQDGQVLHQGDLFPSSNMAYYAELQGDGDLVIHRGSTPSDDRGAIWSAAKAVGYAPQPGRYFMIMRGCRLSIYRGGGPGDKQGLVWRSDGGGGGRCFAILQDSGVIAIFRGTRPADNRGQVWGSDRAGGR
jgi:hypothetical protein